MNTREFSAPNTPEEQPATVNYCGTCKFFDGTANLPPPLTGLCRFGPPGAYYNTSPWWWPKVNPGVDWCGQWQHG